MSYAEFEIPSFITKDNSTQKMVEYCESLAKDLQNLTNSQIRNIYSAVKKIQMEPWDDTLSVRKITLIKPQLTYAAARDSKGGVEVLSKSLIPAIDAISSNNNKQKNFERFCDFFEAILAYHKAK